MSEDIRLLEQEPPASGCPSTEPIPRKLYRIPEDRMIAGVCGGLGAYLGVDPVMIRLSFAAMAFAGGLAIPLYIIAWILMPAEGGTRPARAAPLPIMDVLLVVVGGVLIAAGAAMLPPRLAPWHDDRLVWVLALVAIGMVVLLRGMRSGRARPAEPRSGSARDIDCFDMNRER